MKHEQSTLATKENLAKSLKGFMLEKPFSKITVSEIVNDCDINRKTFYYHFEDIYALLKWMFEQEAVQVVKQFDLLVDYEDAILFIIEYVDSNKHILNCAFDSIGQEGLKRFFYADFIGIMRTVIDSVEKELNLNVNEDFKTFLCSFYTEAVSGMLIDWLKDRTMRDKEKTIQYISSIFTASLPNILLSAQKGFD